MDHGLRMSLFVQITEDPWVSPSLATIQLMHRKARGMQYPFGLDPLLARCRHAIRATAKKSQGPGRLATLELSFENETCDFSYLIFSGLTVHSFQRKKAEGIAKKSDSARRIEI
jgi:hypothetical protein